MTPNYPRGRSSGHPEPERAGRGVHVDVVALTARLEEFDRRISEVKERHVLLDAKTAATVLEAAGQY